MQINKYNKMYKNEGISLSNERNDGNKTTKSNNKKSVFIRENGGKILSRIEKKKCNNRNNKKKSIINEKCLCIRSTWVLTSNTNDRVHVEQMSLSKTLRVFESIRVDMADSFFFWLFALLRISHSILIFKYHI